MKVRRAILVTAFATCQLLVGCHGIPVCETPVPDVPRELTKANMPAYRIETPDVIRVDALRVVPKPPYRVAPLDGLYVNTSVSLPNEPIFGVYTVEPEGVLNLGPSYGSVPVADLTLEEAKAVIEKQLRKVLRDVAVSVSLAQFRGTQQIRGERLVQPDGTIRLGTYGSVYVCGMTVDEAKAAIEQHLSKDLLKPEVAVDVVGFNSKLIYVVLDGGGAGEQVVKLPATGSETVLDAIGSVGGLGPVSARRRIWVARPAPACGGADQILPVDWNGIVRGGRTATNYQMLPGDRLYVMAQPMVTTDTYLARFLSPFERAFGVTLLGSGTVNSIRTNGQLGGNNAGF